MEFFKKFFETREKIDWDKIRESLEPKIEGLKRPAVRLKKASQIKKSKVEKAGKMSRTKAAIVI